MFWLSFELGMTSSDLKKIEYKTRDRIELNSVPYRQSVCGPIFIKLFKCVVKHYVMAWQKSWHLVKYSTVHAGCQI